MSQGAAINPAFLFHIGNYAHRNLHARRNGLPRRANRRRGLGASERPVPLIAEAATRLAAAGIEDPRREARLLLALALETDLAGVLRAGPLTPAQQARFDALVARRAAREPYARIAGHREFWGMDFALSPATLVPRPETETLIEAALAAMPDRASVRRVVDLGTGTGCLLAAALAEYPIAIGIGVDASAEAAAIARRNLARFGGRAAVIVGDWAGALGGGFDLVLSNPPYIPAADIAALAPEVARHDPLAALAGGADGLDAYRAIIAELPRLLAPEGLAVLELGIGQAEAVRALAGAAGLTVADIRPDLAGIPRAAVLRRGLA